MLYVVSEVLKCFSFLFIFFYVQLQWSPLPSLPACWIVSLYHLIYCWSLLVYFLLQLLYSSPLFYSLYFLLVKKFWPPTLLVHSSPWFFKHLHFLSRTQIDCLSPLLLVLLFGIYAFVLSFGLICYFYFYAFGKLVMFPDLGEVAFCRRCLLCPSGGRLSHHQSCVL